MIRLYHVELSGNCHKVRLLLSLLGLEYEGVTVRMAQDEHKTPQFLKLNPFAQVPVLIDGEIILRDSQAILVYLARRYGDENWLPTDAASMAKVMQWLSTAANDIQHGLCAARLYYLFNVKLDLELAQQKADYVLQILDQHLQERQWLECARPTIADIACFPYIGLAPDGKVSLDAYSNVLSWVERIKQLPGYVGMPGLESEVGKIAKMR